MMGDEERVRLDERQRVADLITEHHGTIAEFAADKERAVLLTALVLRLGELPPRMETESVERSGGNG